MKLWLIVNTSQPGFPLLEEDGAEILPIPGRPGCSSRCTTCKVQPVAPGRCALAAVSSALNPCNLLEQILAALVLTTHFDKATPKCSLWMYLEIYFETVPFKFRRSKKERNITDNVTSSHCEKDDTTRQLHLN